MCEIIRLTKRIKDSGECEVSLCFPISVCKTNLLKLSGNELKLYIAIASFMDDRGECYPSQATLATLTGMSPTTINKVVNSLIAVTINDTPILKRKLVRKGNSTYSIYRIPVIGELNDVGYEYEPLNARTILKLFEDKFFEKYGIPYKASYPKDLGLIKAKLLPTYNDEQIKAIIEIVFEEFEKRWRTPSYPHPSIGAICSWLSNSALVIYMERQKNSRSKWDDLEVSDEAYNL